MIGYENKIITSIEVGTIYGQESLVFTFKDNTVLVMTHEQDCCENVYLEDVCGDFEDLIDSPIVYFEERVVEDFDDGIDEHATATFYDIQTLKGSVNLRWIGQSNGYYSEAVEFKYERNAEFKPRETYKCSAQENK